MIMYKYITFVLLGVNILLLAVIYFINNGYRKERIILTEKVDELSYENMLLQDNIILSQQGDCQLDQKMLLCTKSGDSIRLSDIERKEFTLVLRYSTQCCSICVESILRKMICFKQAYPDIDILLLTTYRTDIDKEYLRQICRIFPKVYNVSYLEIPLEKVYVPYLFILDSDMRVINTFIPVRELPELTNRYFKKVVELCQ